MAIAHKKPADMNPEELAAYNEWKEWHDANQEAIDQRDAEIKAMRDKWRQEAEENKKKSAQKMKELAEKQRQQEEQMGAKGSLGWFVNQLGMTRRPVEQIRLDKTEEEAKEFLRAAYVAEVTRRDAQLEDDKNTKTAIAGVARWLVTHPKPGLLLRGYIGVGKTTMMLAIRSVFRILQERRMEIVSARRIAELGKDTKECREELERLKAVPMLGIDDLGTELLIVKSYGNESSPILDLLDERYAYRRFTIITTNLAIKDGVDEIHTVYGDRIYDRVVEMFNTVAYGSQKSYRK